MKNITLTCLALLCLLFTGCKEEPLEQLLQHNELGGTSDAAVSSSEGTYVDTLSYDQKIANYLDSLNIDKSELFDQNQNARTARSLSYFLSREDFDIKTFKFYAKDDLIIEFKNYSVDKNYLYGRA